MLASQLTCLPSLTCLPISHRPCSSIPLLFAYSPPSAPNLLLFHFLLGNPYTLFKTLVSCHLLSDPFSDCPQVSWNFPPLFPQSLKRPPPSQVLTCFYSLKLHLASSLLLQAVNSSKERAALLHLESPEPSRGARHNKDPLIICSVVITCLG